MSAVDPAQAMPAATLPSERLTRASAARIALWSAVIFICVAPFLLVVAISFGNKVEGAAWTWGFSPANYIRVFVGASWPDEVTFLYLQKLYYSLYYSVIASLVAVISAFPFTYLMTGLSKKAQSRWLVFLLASLSLSEVFIVMGWDVLLSNRSGLPMVFEETGLTDWLKNVGWFDTLREWGLANPRNVKFKTSVFATVLTMSYLVWPYAVILLYPALSRLDRSMVEAARTMGAGPWTVMRTVVLPSVRLPLIGSILLLFVFLLGTYVSVTVFAEPAKQTMAVSVYDAVRGNTLNAPFGSAQAVVLLITAGAFLALGQFLSRRAA